MAKQVQKDANGRTFAGMILDSKGNYYSQLGNSYGGYTFPTFALCQKAAETHVGQVGGAYSVLIMSAIASVETEKSPVVVRPIGPAAQQEVNS